MDKRIQELAEQSGVTVLTTHGMEGVVDGCYVIGPARLEKFAKLLIQECTKELETNKRCDIYTGELIDCDWNDVIQHQIDSLKENFEVEE